jgi:hypothetical protein
MEHFTYFIETPAIKSNENTLFSLKLQQLVYNSEEPDDDQIGLKHIVLYGM